MYVEIMAVESVFDPASDTTQIESLRLLRSKPGLN